MFSGYRLYIHIRNTIVSWCYRHLLKPLLFMHDPEAVHDEFVRFGRFLGQFALTRGVVRVLLGYTNPMLKQDILDIHFPNPIGLAAGFDKNAELLQILPSVGFGHVEIGSITALPCEGNKKPRLWRIPEKQSLRVYYGLKNNGYKEILPRVKKEQRGTVGISIAKTNCAFAATQAAGIADYVETYQYCQSQQIGDYVTINISCPNAFGGQPFTDAESFGELMTALSSVKKSLPVFVKLSPDIDVDVLHALLDIGTAYGVDGYICTNLTKRDDEIGGLSGKSVEAAATEMICEVYRYTKGNSVIIGLGGVFTAEDAYTKIKAGASLIQLITGMVYGGPQVVGEINQGLVTLLKKDGYSHLSEAIGVSAHSHNSSV